MDSVAGRAVVVLGLLLGVGVLAVWLGGLGPAPALGDYPGTEELAADYDRYVGEPVSVDGRVVATEPVTIESDRHDAGALTITGLAVDVAPGDRLRVFGVVEPDATVRATEAVAVPPGGLAYTYAVSFLGGLWVLGRLVRHWRVDDDWRLVRRGDPRPGGDDRA